MELDLTSRPAFARAEADVAVTCFSNAGDQTVNEIRGRGVDHWQYEWMRRTAARSIGVIASLPLKRGVSDDIAGAMPFLASALASFITGEVTAINGGAWFV